MATELRRSTRLATRKANADTEFEIELPSTKKSRKSTVNVFSKNKSAMRPPVDAVKEAASGQEEEPNLKELQIGDEMPAVTLKNQEGDDVNLVDVCKKHKIVVIFAYPKASTPGCTRQACGFRDNYEELVKHAAVFGLSADSVKSQKTFQTKQSLPFDLLSDPKRELVGMLGARKTAQGGITRSHWVFMNGKLKRKHVKISPEASVTEGLAEVLDLVKKKKAVKK